LKRRCSGLGQCEVPGQADLSAWLDNLGPVGIDGWIKLELQGVDKNGTIGEGSFFPKIGTQRGFRPSKDNILALQGMCGSGKSMALRAYMHHLFNACRLARKELPHILLITANITYGDNLHEELLRSAYAATESDAGFTQADIGYYRSKSINPTHGTKFWIKHMVLCSLESLQHIPRESKFDLIMLDEVRTIAAAAVGPIMDKHPDNPNLLAHFCENATNIIVCDADLAFTSHISEEPGGAVHAFLKFLAPKRQVVCAQVHAGIPLHIQRYARIYYSSNKTKVNAPVDEGRLGGAEWEACLDRAIRAVVRDRTARIAVFMSTKTDAFSSVARRFDKAKVRYEAYHGDTGDTQKRLLCDPDAAWEDCGGIIATTSLSVGVDPKTTPFSHIFVHVHNNGCSVPGLAQAVMRIGRNPKFPLLEPVINILIGTDMDKAPTQSVPDFRRFFSDMTETEPSGSGLTETKAHIAFGREVTRINVDYSVRRSCENHNWKLVNVPRSGAFYGKATSASSDAAAAATSAAAALCDAHAAHKGALAAGTKATAADTKATAAATTAAAAATAATAAATAAAAAAASTDTAINTAAAAATATAAAAAAAAAADDDAAAADNAAASTAAATATATADAAANSATDAASAAILAAAHAEDADSAAGKAIEEDGKARNKVAHAAAEAVAAKEAERTARTAAEALLRASDGLRSDAVAEAFATAKAANKKAEVADRKVACAAAEADRANAIHAESAKSAATAAAAAAAAAGISRKMAVSIDGRTIPAATDNDHDTLWTTTVPLNDKRSLLVHYVRHGGPGEDVNDQFAVPLTMAHDDEGVEGSPSSLHPLRDAFVLMASAIASAATTSAIGVAAAAARASEIPTADAAGEPTDTATAPGNATASAFLDAAVALGAEFSTAIEGRPTAALEAGLATVEEVHTGAPPVATTADSAHGAAAAAAAAASTATAAAAAAVAVDASTMRVSQTASAVKAANAEVKAAKAEVKAATPNVNPASDANAAADAAPLDRAKAAATEAKAVNASARSINGAADSLAAATNAAARAATARVYAVSNPTEEAAHAATVAAVAASDAAKLAATQVSTFAKTVAFTETAAIKTVGAKLLISDEDDRGNHRVQKFLWNAFGLVKHGDSDVDSGDFTGKEKAFRDLCFLLKSIHWLPPNNDEGLQIMSYMKINHGKLHVLALLLVLTPEQQELREDDQARRAGSDTGVRAHVLSNKMRAATDFLAFIKFTADGLCLNNYAPFECGHPIMLDTELVTLWNKGQGGDAPSKLKSSAKVLASKNLTTFQKALSACASALGFVITAETDRPVVDGKQRLRTTALRLEMNKFGPQIIGAWLVWSDTLGTKVRIRDWHSKHREHAEEKASYQITAWDWDLREDALAEPRVAEPREAPMPDIRFARRERYDGRVLAAELTRLNARPATRRNNGEKRDLSFLTKLDEACGPTNGDGTRFRDVQYYKPPHGGRRYGHGPCNQHCAKDLRLRLGQRLYHDIDIVNCHPTVLLHYAESNGLYTPHLLKYVQHRDAVLQNVADFYGLAGTSLCKFAVLILLNGGSVEKWAFEAECPNNSDRVAPELQAMECEFTYIRDHMLNKTFKDETAQWMELLREQTQLRVTGAAEECNKVFKDPMATPDDKAAAKLAFDTARWKSGDMSLNRRCFSIRTHDLEDALLAVVDETLRAKGWVVASLIFDGVMTEHRTDASITDAIRDAEDAVKRLLKYKHFKLVEKGFFNTAGYGGATSDGVEEDTGNGGDAGASHGAAEEGSSIVAEAVQTMAMEIDDDYGER
jgi:hypothetical protein